MGGLFRLPLNRGRRTGRQAQISAVAGSAELQIMLETRGGGG